MTYLARIASVSLLITSLIAACSSCASVTPVEKLPPPLDNQAALAENALQSSVILLSVDGNPSCAGTFIAPWRIITAAHCVRDQTHWVQREKEVDYITFDAWNAKHFDSQKGVLLRWDEEGDVALIVTEHMGPAHVRLGPEPVIGDMLFSIGHPNLDYFTVAAGMLSVRRVPVEGGEYYKVLIAIYYGSSGGGLYDSEWHLIGVASRMSLGGGIGYFGNVDAVHDILKG